MLPDPDAWGISTGYEDFRGVRRQAPSETIAAILEAMEADGERPSPARVLVVTPGDRIPAPTAVAVEVEGGGRAELAGGLLPRDLPFGYHQLVHRDGSATRLVFSPGASHLPNALFVWGWALQLYSARSKDSWGIGDLHDLARFGNWARSTGAAVLLINPLSAVPPGLPQQPSPYSPVSRCFLNPLYLRIEDVTGASEAGVLLREAGQRGRALNSRSVVDRDAVYEVKMQALRALWERFQGSAAFDSYRLQGGKLLEGFATYCALAEELGGNRFAWPARFQRPDSSAVARWRRDHPSAIGFHLWLQWALDHQLAQAERDIGLIHDLPVGVDPAGADAWMWQDVFAPGMGIGAPPDELSRAGQSWGLAPFDPWKLQAAGYEPFIQTVRAALRHGTGLRIDHVMGLFRLYWVPDGMPAGAGTYVGYPAEDLLSIVALESYRAGAFIVGEDLGTVEERVRAEMKKRKMLSYRVMWFEDDAPAAYPELALATVTNHDLPTIAGVWTGADLDEQHRVLAAPNIEGMNAMRSRLKKLVQLPDDAPVEEVIATAYEVLSAAPSRVVIATLEDALGMPSRPNIPGTSGERPNWSQPLTATMEEVATNNLVERIAGILTRRRPPRSEQQEQ